MDLILVEDPGAWRMITLNRPDRLNSFNEAMHHALANALLEAANDVDCRAVLLTGAGRGFCAGQDLSEVAADGEKLPDLGATIETFYNPLIRRIRGMRKPVVCAVNGTAAGAGANLAFACDIVLAARSAKFIQSFAKIGLVPDSGGTWLLPRLIGEARAKALAMTGASVSADEAQNWGLIWRAIDDDKLMGEAIELASNLATQPTQALAMIKTAIERSATSTLDVHLDLERDMQREAGLTPDYAEGVQAFVAKRKPVFTGRPRKGE